MTTRERTIRTSAELAEAIRSVLSEVAPSSEVGFAVLPHVSSDGHGLHVELRPLPPATKSPGPATDPGDALLLEGEERWRSIVESTAAGVALLSPDGRFQQVNQALVDFLGFPEATLLATTLEAVTHPLDRPRLEQSVGPRANTPPAPLDLEQRFLRANGSTVWGHVTISWLRSSASSHHGVCLILDISERQAARADLAHVVDEEQRRIGRDLHDSVGQLLTGITHLAEALLESLGHADGVEVGAVRDRVRRIAAGLHEALEEVRRVSSGLLPLAAGRDLIDSLRDLAQRTDGLGEVSCAFRCDAPVDVSDQSVATQLYRVAQEAVTNALKHAKASSILISLTSDADSICLEVSDDGIGVHRAALDAPGLGLRSMRYRAQLLGGAVSVEGADGGGTRVSCTVPRSSTSG